MDFIFLGPTPPGEQCAQVGAGDYPECSRRECTVFKRMLARVHPIPEGINATYVVKSSPHDMGTYREVGMKYDETCPKATEIAFTVERMTPEHWDDLARYELAWYERRDAYAQALREGKCRLCDVPSHFNSMDPPVASSTATFAEIEATFPLRPWHAASQAHASAQAQAT